MQRAVSPFLTATADAMGSDNPESVLSRRRALI